jgi:ubiquinone/menaquinone biosynthesis C-methylase UbiE
MTTVLDTRPDQRHWSTVKQRQQATWASGDYAVIGTTLQIVGESLAEAADIRGGERVIDIAAGNGNATLAAARRFAEVTSTDYVLQLLECGAARARAEGHAIDFRVADAEALPFADASFDVALSTFGVMFTADHRAAAAEMLRVVRPGGRIALASWTPTSFVGELLRTVTRHVPPPAGAASPLPWGTESYLVDLFGPAAADIRCARREYVFRYKSPAHWLQIFRDYYGPTYRAFATLDAEGQAALAAEILALLTRLNRGGATSLVIQSEYLEAVIVRS